MGKLDREGTVLLYDDTGETDLAPVVLLHGLSSARATWRPLTGALAGRFRVVALDDRGHGESDHAPGTYTLPHYEGDAIALLEEVVGRPAVLVGHSLGGVIAASVARDRPDLVRGVVLEDPPLYVGTRRSDDASPMLAMFGLMRQVLAEMQGRAAPLEEYEAMLAGAPAMRGVGTMAEVFGAEGTRDQARAMAGLDPEIFSPALDGSGLAGAANDVRLACPVLVVRADPALGAAFSAEDEAAFLATNPDATIRVVDGASHLIHDEQPDRFLSEVEGFLDALGD